MISDVLTLTITLNSAKFKAKFAAFFVARMKMVAAHKEHKKEVESYTSRGHLVFNNQLDSYDAVIDTTQAYRDACDALADQVLLEAAEDSRVIVELIDRDL